LSQARVASDLQCQFPKVGERTWVSGDGQGKQTAEVRASNAQGELRVLIAEILVSKDEVPAMLYEMAVAAKARVENGEIVVDGKPAGNLGECETAGTLTNC
jgi:hypothetical protein